MWTVTATSFETDTGISVRIGSINECVLTDDTNADLIDTNREGAGRHITFSLYTTHNTHRSHSMPTRMAASLAGSPAADMTMMVVMAPVAGIPAAPMLDKAAVTLQKCDIIAAIFTLLSLWDF